MECSGISCIKDCAIGGACRKQSHPAVDVVTEVTDIDEAKSWAQPRSLYSTHGINGSVETRFVVVGFSQNLLPKDFNTNLLSQRVLLEKKLLIHVLSGEY